MKYCSAHHWHQVPCFMQMLAPQEYQSARIYWEGCRSARVPQCTPLPIDHDSATLETGDWNVRQREDKITSAQLLSLSLVLQSGHCSTLSAYLQQLYCQHWHHIGYTVCTRDPDQTRPPVEEKAISGVKIHETSGTQLMGVWYLLRSSDVRTTFYWYNQIRGIENVVDILLVLWSR